MRALRGLLAPLFICFIALAAGFTGLASASSSSARESSPKPASTAPTVQSVIELVLGRNPGMKSYVAHARLDVRQVNFPYLHPGLDGKVYYLSPGFTMYDFPHTPSYLQGITKVEGSVGAATRWRRCYNITLENRDDAYVLHMVPKILGEVAEMTVSVDKRSGNPLFFNWTYHKPNDSVSLWQTFSIVGGFDVVTAQRADITKHPIRAKATGTFDSFQYNVPVPTPTPTPSDPLHQCDN